MALWSHIKTNTFLYVLKDFFMSWNLPAALTCLNVWSKRDAALGYREAEWDKGLAQMELKTLLDHILIAADIKKTHWQTFLWSLQWHSISYFLSFFPHFSF